MAERCLGGVQVAASGARVLRRLQTYEAAARFQVAAEAAVRWQADGSELHLAEVHLGMSQAGAALANLASVLAGNVGGLASGNRPAVVAVAGDQGERQHEPVHTVVMGLFGPGLGTLTLIDG